MLGYRTWCVHVCMQNFLIIFMTMRNVTEALLHMKPALQAIFPCSSSLLHSRVCQFWPPVSQQILNLLKIFFDAVEQLARNDCSLFLNKFLFSSCQDCSLFTWTHHLLVRLTIIALIHIWVCVRPNCESNQPFAEHVFKCSHWEFSCCTVLREVTGHFLLLC